MARRGPWDSLQDILADLTALEELDVKATYFEQINSGLSGSVSTPSGSTIELDAFGGGVDALVSTMSNGLPTYEIAKTAGGVEITATLDAAGNWTLSDTPSSYPVALIYAYTTQLQYFDADYKILAYELGKGGVTGDHGGLTGLSDDDHTQYLNVTRHDADDHSGLLPIDHGTDVNGLSDDDHTQYVLADGTRDIAMAPASDWEIKDTDGDVLAKFTSNGAAELYYDSTVAIQTTTEGVDFFSASGEQIDLVWTPAESAQDLTTFTEVDEDSDITLAESQITVSSMRRDADSYVYYDMGVGNCKDFSVEFSFEVSEAEASTGSAVCGFANHVGSYDDIETAGYGIIVSYYDQDASSAKIRLKDFDNGNSDPTASYGATISRRYCKFYRVGTTCKLEIYTDASMETLEDTLTITCTTTDFRYFYVCANLGKGNGPISNTTTWTGYDYRLSLDSVIIDTWSLISREDSAALSLKGYDVDTQLKTILYGNPNSAAELYYDGTKVFETTASGISITDGTATATTIGFSSDDLVIKNNDPDGLIQLYARNSADSADNLILQGDPDGAAGLYYAGSLRVSTGEVGVTITSGTPTALIGFDSDDLFIRNNDPDGLIQLYARNAADSSDNLILQGDPDGEVELRYNGTKEFATQSNGAYVPNGSFRVGTADTTRGLLTITGDNGDLGGQLFLQTGATSDSNIDDYRIQVAGEDFYIGFEGDADSLMFYDYSEDLMYLNSVSGSVALGRNDLVAGLLTLYGGSADTGGGKIRIYEDANDDAESDYWEIGAYGGDLRIYSKGGSFGTEEILRYDGGTNSWLLYSHEGSGDVDLNVGYNDAGRGAIRLYSDASNGGLVRIYVEGDSDGTIDYYSLQCVNDDLYIGPSNNNDALVYNGGGSRWDVDAHFYPKTNNSFNLGGPSNCWNNLYATNTPSCSDKREKESIKQETLGLDFINSLVPISFLYTEDRISKDSEHYGRRQHGFVAQEVEAVIEELGHKFDDFFGVQYNKELDLYQLNYVQFIAPLVKAVQELTERVEKLENV